MMSVSRPMTAGHAEHYFSKDDYYLSSQGTWQGGAAQALGLDGPVQREDFRSLAAGHDPDTGETLVSPGPGGEHRSGVDITFSAPKSVSLLSLADERLQDAHRAAVTQTLEYIESRYAQARTTEGGITRQVETGNLAIAKFDHMISREMDPQLHTHSFVFNLTQRPDGEWRALRNEPLFEHQLFLGQVYRNELAREVQNLGYAITITDRAQGFFEIKGVPRELLDEFSKRREQVIERVMELKASGEYAQAREAQLYEIAALGSRKEKEEVSRETLLQRWNQTLKEKGWTLDRLKEHTMQEMTRIKEQQPRKEEVHTYVRQAAGAVTEREAVFYRESVLEIGLKLSLGEKGIKDLEHAYQELQKERAIKQLGQDKEGQDVFTTKEMLKIERAIVSNIHQQQGTLEGVNPQTVDHYLRGLKSQGVQLTPDQKAAIRTIAEAKDAVLLIQGDAGTGKTAAMAHVKTLLEKDGWSVRGLAFTGKAAAELQRGSGIEGQTLASFLKQSEYPKSREVWIVDEASMIGSKDLHRLLSLAKEGQVKVVLVGDRKQFQSIEAGRMFSLLQEKGHVQTVIMTQTLRQQDAILKETVHAISAKEMDRAFYLLEQKGRLVEIPDRAERLKAVAREYLNLQDQGKTALVLTALNQDRIALNHQIRSERVARGEIFQGRTFQVLESVNIHPAWATKADAYKPGQLIVTTGKVEELKAGTRLEVVGIHPEHKSLIGQVQEKKGSQRQVAIDPGKFSGKLLVFQRVERNFSEGDRVVFLKNDRQLGIQNGAVGKIDRLDVHGNVQVKTLDGKEIRFNMEGGPRLYSSITHAYALTEYKSQGQTVDAVIWHAQAKDSFKQMNTANSFYVSITRAREDAKVFTDSKADLKEQVKHEQVKASTLDYPREAPDQKRGRETTQGKERDGR
jgi:conjugative relaxase-like TrwC/TraI family protein